MNKKLFWIGLLGVLIGFLIPFLTVLHIIESNLFLLFFSHAASVGGLFLGIISVAQAALKQRTNKHNG